ncbi:universal stress protein [Spongiactinospora sp. 9N601]|uniref:universal stress protein n=1 Tax=Spongiactinospora sp. 9N601 TaxID=3375149 RepID=UPI00379A322B
MREHITVGVDGSGGSWAALAWAVRDAARRERPLRIVYALDLHRYIGAPPVAAGFTLGQVFDRLSAHGREIVGRAAGWARTHGSVTTSTQVCVDAACRVLAGQTDAAFEVVVGQGREQGRLARLWPGSVGRRLLIGQRGPVVIVGGHAERPGDDVVVVLSAGDAMEAALRYGCEAAALRGARLRIVAPAHAASRAEAVAERVRSGPWQVEVRVQRIAGDLAPALRAASVTARLMVLGADLARRGSVWRRSLASRLIGRLACPIAVVPAAPAA